MVDIPTSPLLGVNLGQTSAGTSTAGAGAPQALGTTIFGSHGSVYQFVQAAVAINQYDVVSIDNNSQASGATPATLATGATSIGFAQAAFAQYDYGWVALQGSQLTVNVSATSTLAVQLYAATTTGKLSTTASSGTLVGVAILTASTTAVVGTTLAVVSYPQTRAFG